MIRYSLIINNLFLLNLSQYLIKSKNYQIICKLLIEFENIIVYIKQFNLF